MLTIEAEPVPASNGVGVPEWRRLVSRYERPSKGRAAWQIANSFGPYLCLWYLMYRSLAFSPWLTFILAVLAAAMLIRVFIIFHDCVHGSYFRSRLANGITGSIAGLLTFTPYTHWRWEHSRHHATAGDLDRRGTGDIWTMTVQEYLESPRWKRLAYRVARNPIVLFLLAPLLLFLIWQRIPSPGASRRDRRWVWWMNAAILGMVAVMSQVFGLVPYLLIQMTVMAVAGAAGVWLFYVQHQFDGAYWERSGDWDYTAAALRGSSYYKLPRPLQWLSGNIGFHHIHHLSARIPNYNLEECHNAHPFFQQVKPVTLLTSLKSLGYRLWDERQRKLVGFRHLRGRREAVQGS